VTPVFAQLGIVALNPVNAASGVCYDTPLQITFDSVPKVTTSGAIRIYNTTNTVVPVDVVDLSLGNLQQRTFPGDSQPFNVYSVLVKDTTATIFPHAGVLTSNESYYVTIDAGVFTDSLNAPFEGISDATTWAFNTRPFGPADPTNLIVAADGTGDFVSVQGAVDSVSSGNTIPTTIRIQNGDYVELVNISGKDNLLLRGQSREGTIVGYANNANIAPGGTTHARMAFKVNGNDISIDNLTITNRTPQGGSQAEALMLESDVKRFIANNVTVASYQDTILANTPGTQGYFQSCLVQGDVDFIWGGGNLFFTNCEIRSLRSSADVSQPRQPAGSNGFSFVSCRFTRSSPSITGCRFARDLNYTFSSVAIIRCLVDLHITGWETTHLIGFGTKNPNLRWWEYGNSNITATASVEYQGHQIGVTNNDLRLETAENSFNWLYGWNPQLMPNIISYPQSQYFVSNQTVTLAVVATGIPEPEYQWLKNATNLVGETGSTLNISNAGVADAGTYSVVVSNVVGVLTSESASLTLLDNPISPTLSALTVLENGNFSFALSGASGQPYRIWGSTNAALSPMITTWTLLSNGVFGEGPVEFMDSRTPDLHQRFYSVTVP
jgi:pectin methylesterase-like acyl-CoA thioesterase